MTPDLSREPWLTEPATRAVMDALETAGGRDCARFVGGCVRNALIGQPVSDIDIATVLTPSQVITALTAAGLKSVPTGVEHGTVTAISARKPYEITTLRRDVETDGRRAVVAFTDDWAEDAARRDFRLNALYADAEGRVFDPTGHGVADAAAGRIVFVGEAERRIWEDYLRILRFFRFHAWYGRGAPDAEGLAACARLADGVDTLSAERVSKELLRLLEAPDPRQAVAAMRDAGVLAHVLREAADLRGFDAAAAQSSDVAARLMMLLPPDPDAMRVAAKRLRFSNGLRDRLVSAAGTAEAASRISNDRQARAVAWRAGVRATVDALRRRAWDNDEHAALDLAERLEGWTPPPRPVGGVDLARLGVAPGPETGRILRAFEDCWIEDDFPTDGHAERLERLVRDARAATR